MAVFTADHPSQFWARIGRIAAGSGGSRCIGVPAIPPARSSSDCAVPRAPLACSIAQRRRAQRSLDPCILHPPPHPTTQAEDLKFKQSPTFADCFPGSTKEYTRVEHNGRTLQVHDSSKLQGRDGGGMLACAGLTFALPCLSRAWVRAHTPLVLPRRGTPHHPINQHDRCPSAACSSPTATRLTCMTPAALRCVCGCWLAVCLCLALLGDLVIQQCSPSCRGRANQPLHPLPHTHPERQPAHRPAQAARRVGG